MIVTESKPSPPSINLQIPGTFSPIAEAPILTRSDGYLKRRLVDIGDRVDARRLLGVIETPDFDDQVAEAAKLVEQSNATLQQSRTALEQASANAVLPRLLPTGVTIEKLHYVVDQSIGHLAQSDLIRGRDGLFGGKC